MLVRTALCLLVATSGAYALLYREAVQFSSLGDCTADDGRTAASLTVNYRRRRGITSITTNHLPNHEWTCVNPNEPAGTESTYTFSDQPEILGDDAVYCLPQGPIAIAKNGVRIFNPTTSDGGNAAELEVMDCNGGHSDQRGVYHYHSLPDNGIVYDSDDSSPQFIGVALDGNPIYSAGPNTNMDELDICHGMNDSNGRYRYIASQDHFPYFLGCYRSAPQVTSSATQGKCSGMTAGSACTCEMGLVTAKKRSVSPKLSLKAKRNTCAGGFCGEGNGECARKKNLQDKRSEKAQLLQALLQLLEK